MRKNIVAGNWKMHGSQSMVESLLSDLKVKITSTQCEVIVFPPFVYLPQAKVSLENSNIKLGAQNVAMAESGAFTGEVSATMLTEFACDYVLIGHSERRQYFAETNEQIVQKLLLSIRHGLKPIVCVGETLQEREAKNTFEVIKSQINPILALENCHDLLQNTVLAYEPIWAIGTGLTASPEQAQEVHNYIRSLIANVGQGIAEKVSILYGGSVKPSNAAGLFAQPDIDGALVGGASLKANDFLEIIQCNS